MGTGHVDQGTTVCLMDFQDVDPDVVAFLIGFAGDLLAGAEHGIGLLVAGADAHEHVAAGGIDPQHGAGEQLLCLGGVGLVNHAPLSFADALNDHLLEGLGSDAAELLHFHGNVQKIAHLGVGINIPVDINKFGRIAAQTAKQVVIQGIREAERGVMYESYSSKAQELLTGTVLRLDPSGDIFVRIGQGNEQSDAVLRVSEQIPGESYSEGDLIRVYVLEVHKATRGPLVHVSRTHPNVVRRLFELETPEIADGQVEIKNIAREAGSRSKIAVRAVMEGIDPVGTCVGPRGGRVGAVVEELHGEKIDIVVWSEDPCQYVQAALSPADVVSVTLIPGQKACRVIVPDDQLSLAIGKEGQNARLAARLTGYKIDIKPASQANAD